MGEFMSRSNSTTSMPLKMASVRSPRSVQQVQRQCSQPSLKAASGVASPRVMTSPRSPVRFAKERERVLES